MAKNPKYSLPKYAREILSETGGVPWEKATPVPAMDAYSGLVTGSFHLFENVGNIGKVAYYESKFAIDGDGSGGETPGDTYLPDTSLHFGDGKPLNAHHFPFAVIPMVREIDQGIAFEGAPIGIQLGDIGIAFWKKRRAAFIYGDRGPHWKKVGEGSINLADLLGIDSDPNDGGIGASEVPPGVIHVVFPGTSDVADADNPRTNRTPKQIADLAEDLFMRFVHA